MTADDSYCKESECPVSSHPFNARKPSRTGQLWLLGSIANSTLLLPECNRQWPMTLDRLIGRFYLERCDRVLILGVLPLIATPLLRCPGQVWDLKDLGIQATQRIAKASDALRSLGDISQNFPNLAATLSRSPVDKAVRAELRRNQGGLPGGALPLLVCALCNALSPEVPLDLCLQGYQRRVVIDCCPSVTQL